MESCVATFRGEKIISWLVNKVSSDAVELVSCALIWADLIAFVGEIKGGGLVLYIHSP